MPNLMGKSFKTSFKSSIKSPSMRNTFIAKRNDLGEFVPRTGLSGLGETDASVIDRLAAQGYRYYTGYDYFEKSGNYYKWDSAQQILRPWNVGSGTYADTSTTTTGTTTTEEDGTAFDYQGLFSGIGSLLEGLGTGAGSIMQAYYSKDTQVPGTTIDPGSSLLTAQMLQEQMQAATKAQQEASAANMLMMQQLLQQQNQLAVGAGGTLPGTTAGGQAGGVEEGVWDKYKVPIVGAIGVGSALLIGTIVYLAAKK